MADYIQITATGIEGVEQRELLLALLAAEGCEGFEEEADILRAYIPGGDLTGSGVEEILKENNIKYSLTTIKEQNWNAVWEAQFDPVVIEDLAAIRASFHEPIPQVKFEIVITPKMSFGTGHHATTYMMITEMAKLDFSGKRVFDFGTGTGVLAILAEKMGAATVIGIDNDTWSISNAEENIAENGCKHISILQKDEAEMGEIFDVILANINKHILLANMPVLAKQLEKGGTLILSGLLEEDEEDITRSIESQGLMHIRTVKRSRWICIAASR
ncbi:50S ribosomal protein L11 methyltransferase [Filimonas effusa]|uniref:Ribosomal protein L11 methyltransferase n=1 Tax=Filimonas effusa TaxID=2508721 RepID=A0A4Q1DC30_9BACT|nr:50S ribosomal protein L11 methyltransferase [Filimonas effusa]RXK86498.1 50S ribosomal protein L11 methyltransferase [Filimonas effusa]